MAQDAIESPVSVMGLLIGGLKEGKNVIETIISKVSSAPESPNFSIRIYKPAKDSEERQKVVSYLEWNIDRIGKNVKEFYIEK